MVCLIHVSLLTVSNKLVEIITVADALVFCKFTKLGEIARGRILFDCVDEELVHCCRKPAVTTPLILEMSYPGTGRVEKKKHVDREKCSLDFCDSSVVGG